MKYTHFYISWRSKRTRIKILSAYSTFTHKDVRTCRDKFSHSEVFEKFNAKKFENPV